MARLLADGAGARLAFDGKTLIQADGQSVPLQLVQKHPSNKSWFNETSKEFFQRRSLRVRGVPNGAAFVARTIWPEDYDRVFDQGALPLLEAGKSGALKDEIQGLIEGPARAENQLAVRLLWERIQDAASGTASPCSGSCSTAPRATTTTRTAGISASSPASWGPGASGRTGSSTASTRWT